MGMHLRTCKGCKRTMDSSELNNDWLCSSCARPRINTKEKKMDMCNPASKPQREPEPAMIPAPEFVRGDKVRLKDFYYPEDGEWQYHTVTRVRWDESWWYNISEIDMTMAPKVLERYEG